MPKLSNPFALPLRDYDLNPYVHPTILREGYAGHVIGLDGTDYVDFLSSWGTNLLGYGYLPVAQAAAAQVGRFAAVGVPYPGFNDLIRLLQDTLPGAEAVRFGKNGSDACAGAVRVARAVTGRETILYRGYHGFHDWYMASTDCAGIPACLHKTLAPIPDLRPSVIDERLRESPDGVAALILNPLVGPIPTADEIREVIDVVHRHGALVIFDEMMSGFRVAVGGMQEVWGVGADLACYGKSIANGLPLAALTGRTELMARLPETYYGMTFEGEAVSIAAAEATVREVKRLDVVGALYDKGRAIRAGYERLAAEYGVRTHLGGFEPCLHLEFEDQAPLMRRELLWLTIQDLVRDGIFTLGSFVLCYSHRDEDLGRLLPMAFSLILIQVRSPMLFAVGMYLPLETTFAIFVGGMLRGYVDRRVKARGYNTAQSARVDNAVVLVASGLIAGEALMGLLVAAVVFQRNAFWDWTWALSAPLAILFAIVLAAYLVLVPLSQAGAADEPAPPTAVM